MRTREIRFEKWELGIVLKFKSRSSRLAPGLKWTLSRHRTVIRSLILELLPVEKM